MKTLEEARNALAEAREQLKTFQSELSLEKATALAVGDPTTVEVLGLKNLRKALLEDIIKAEEELKNVKKA